jgi:nucleoside-diphosphate-sugar epimerase
LNHILGKGKDPLLTLSVHIDDVAKAHIQALQKSVPAGRYLLDSEGPGHTNWSDAVPFVKKYYPEAVGNVFAEDAKPFAIKIVLDNSKAEKAFGIKFKNFEEQVKDTAGFYLSLLPK